jgi:hypothetical protein
MTCFEMLQFLAANGFSTLMWPTIRTGGCVSTMEYHVVADRLDGARLGEDSAQYFIEVIRNRGGGESAMVYAYPRPPELVGDVTWSVDVPSSIPAKFLQERYMPDDGETFRSSHECIGLRQATFDAQYRALASGGLPPKVWAGSAPDCPRDVLEGVLQPRN